MPLRLTDLPAGVVWALCRTTLRTGALPGWADGAVTGIRAGKRIGVYLADIMRPRNASDFDIFVPNRTVAGHPAMWTTPSLWVLNAGGTDIKVSGADEAEAVRVVEGLRRAGDPARAATWPPRVVG